MTNGLFRYQVLADGSIKFGRVHNSRAACNDSRCPDYAQLGDPYHRECRAIRARLVDEAVRATKARARAEARARNWRGR